MQFEESNISVKAASAIRDMIIAGSLPDGERINEVHLAEALQISRTPLREGLSRLVAEGQVLAKPRRGFFVASLDRREFEQIYDIRPLLDPEALRLTGIPSAACLDRLEALNRKLLSAKGPAKAIDIDNAWHRELLSECPNRVLTDLIDQMMERTRRYEHALFRETKNVWNAGNDHELIITALKDNDLTRACNMVKRNMQSGKVPIIDWLSARPQKKQH